MPTKCPEVLDFLQTRRSRPAKTLSKPAPDQAELLPLLEIAARSPDHGMLEPWRFLVLSDNALPRLANAARKRSVELGEAEEKCEKCAAMFANAPLMVAVVCTVKPSPKVPEKEQILSAGAVCLSLLNAALASGWGANWLSGPMAFDAAFCADELSLNDNEFVAGFIVIGTQTIAPAERPRPDISAKTTWVVE